MEDKQLSELVIQYVLTIPEDEFAGVSVENLARIFKVDRFKLSREFKHQVKMKLEDFLFKEKMMRAALMLLAYRDITVKEVSERIGFSTCDYFIRVFRQFYGVVPGRFKELKTPQSWESRGNEVEERRQKVMKDKIPESGDRRKEKKDRKNWQADLKNQNGYYYYYPENPLQAWCMEQNRTLIQEKAEDGLNTTACKNCYFLKFALNFDDWK